MGLVVNEIPTGGTLVSTGIAPGGAYLGPSSVTVVNTGYVFTNNTSSDIFSDITAFDTSIYRILSMQDDMKTVYISGMVSNEFELFLQYAEDLTVGNPTNEGFISINTYLGSLGV